MATKQENPFAEGDRVGWKAAPTAEEKAQIERWEEEYGPGPYEVVGLHAHPEVDHVVLETPSGKGPRLPFTYFERAEELAA
jgi:hypothetical protein